MPHFTSLFGDGRAEGFSVQGLKELGFGVWGLGFRV